MIPVRFQAAAGARRLARLSCALLVVLGLSIAAAPAAAAPTPITQGAPLEWGFKVTWRSYVGEPAYSGGASRVPDSSAAGYDIGWAFDSGTYDPEGGTTVLRYEGTVRWTKYNTRDFPSFATSCNEPRDYDILDVTISDPIVTLSRDGASISALARSRNCQLVDYGRVEIVNLGVKDAAAPVVSGGTTTWNAIPATISEAATRVFGDSYYPAGQQVDPVGFAYTGPGGRPDFSEVFDAPGSTKLASDGDNALVAPRETPNGEVSVWATQPERRLVHFRSRLVEDGVVYSSFQAFDLEERRNVGEPLKVTASEINAGFLLNESTTGRLFYGGSAGTYPKKWLRYDRAAGRYERGETAGTIPSTSDNPSLNWDPVGRRAWEIRRLRPDGTVPPASQPGQWRLRTYTEQSDGTWALTAYELPNQPQDLNANLYRTGRSGVVASDGSFVIPGDRRRSLSGQPVPSSVPGAFRIVTRSDGTADVTPVPGTDLPNPPSGPPTFDTTLAGPDGMVALVDLDGAGSAQRVDVTPSGGASIAAEAKVDLGFPVSELSPSQAAIDPTDGTTWVGGLKSRRVVAVRDGQLVGEQVIANLNTRQGALIATAGHRLFALSDDGSEPGPDTTAVGLQRLRRLGFSPTVTGSPADRSVTLAAGEPSKPVTFTAAATGDPDADPQWQVKPAGATRFRDVPGQTGGSLTVAATREADGGEYRAVFSNAAGRIATEPAKLSVRFAPEVKFPPLSVTVPGGEDAQFSVLTTGNPEPAVLWQRQVLGFWEPVDPESGDFEIDGNTLTVKNVSRAADGTRFRARVRNDVATAFSEPATLTVRDPAPPTQTTGQLDWGVRASFRNYVVGPIAKGEITLSRGAERNADGSFRFPVGSGSFTPGTERSDATAAGTVRFYGHNGQLDATISDPRVQTEGRRGVLIADVVSKGLQDPAPVTYDDVELVDLDLANATVTPSSTGVVMRNVATTLTAEGAPAFGGFYRAGEAMDPLDLTLSAAPPTQPPAGSTSGSGPGASAPGTPAAAPPAALPPGVAGAALPARDPVASRVAARVRLLRARISGGVLVLVATVTRRAAGKVQIRYRAGRRTLRFNAAVRKGRVRVKRRLPRAMTRGPGLVLISYRGDPAVRRGADRLRVSSVRGRR